MRFAPAAVFGLLLLAGRGTAAPEATRVELDAPPTVQGLWLRDVDGDGADDVLLLGGRRITVFAGRGGALPEAAPRWTVDLGAPVTFVDVLPPVAGQPVLLTLGRAGARRVTLADGQSAPLPGANAKLDWTDCEQADFAPLVRAGGVLLPTPDGVAWHGANGGAARLAVERFRDVVPAGGFLQDTTIVTEALPQVWLSPGNEPLPALWALGGTRLLGPGAASYDLSFLPREGTRRLADLDGDGRPDVIHEGGGHRERTYAFFRTPEGGGDLRPPTSVLRLSGYSLDPDLVDLDGDGLLDFVVTVLPTDARNTMRALGGKVTANTKAYLNQGPGKAFVFSPTPNVSVASDVGIAIRFTPGGQIQIRRSLTILVTGDYDGDGLKDLAIRTGDETLTVRAGRRGRAVWAAEGRDVAIPPAPSQSPGVEGHTADLTGDGSDEIVLVYRKAHGGRDRVWVVRP